VRCQEKNSYDLIIVRAAKKAKFGKGVGMVALTPRVAE
jgi:hypothetical protein